MGYVSASSVVRCRGGGEAYSRLPTTHGHITDCKLDSVVYAGVRYGVGGGGMFRNLCPVIRDRRKCDISLAE